MCVLNIAICDDSPMDIEKVESIFEKMVNKAFEYDVFFSGEELLTYTENHSIKYNLYILDIEMEKMNGLSLAKKIRESDSKALIVFLTSYSSYVFEVFEIITFDFILKPITYEKLNIVLDKVMNYLQLTKKNFTFSYRQNHFTISCDEISYIEKKGRQAFIHTDFENYKSNMTIADIWKQLDKNVFSHIHESIIVNLEYIREIKRDELCLKDGKLLYISRVHKHEVKEKHLAYLKEKI
ncbi:MAG: LytR/AlgR family response regulator transcription factor [Lachnotalea sp.]